MSDKMKGAGQPRRYSTWEWARAYAAWVLLLPLYLVFAAFGLVGKVPFRKLLLRWHERVTSRPMDFRIPPDPTVPVYMERWWAIPRNWAFNIYVHIVRRSDDDRALHDHPWWSFSIVLEGGYYEETILAGGIHKRVWRGPGSCVFRYKGSLAHRLELESNEAAYDGHDSTISDRVELPAKTIFITGPVLRRWGFHDPKRGWVDAYDWDRHCETYGIESMKMDGGSDAVISERNHHRSN